MTRSRSSECPSPARSGPRFLTFRIGYGYGRAVRVLVDGRLTRPPCGEWEAIALAVEVGASAILIDDRPARRLAESSGLSVIGTLGLLLQAKRAGHIESIRAELDKLRATSFFLSQQLYDTLLRMAGE